MWHVTFFVLLHFLFIILFFIFNKHFSTLVVTRRVHPYSTFISLPITTALAYFLIKHLILFIDPLLYRKINSTAPAFKQASFIQRLSEQIEQLRGRELPGFMSSQVPPFLVKHHLSVLLDDTHLSTLPHIIVYRLGQLNFFLSFTALQFYYDNPTA